MRLRDLLQKSAVYCTLIFTMAISFGEAQTEENWPPPGLDRDWATYQNDFQRTGRSLSGLGNINCDLSLLWSYSDPNEESRYAGPIIKDGRVVQAFGDRYRIFDLATGAVLHEIVTGGEEIYCTPTIASVRLGDDYFGDLLFLAGGTSGQVLAFLWSDVEAGPLWTWTAPGSGQAVRFGGFVVLNDAGDDVLYVEVNQSMIYAIRAADGLDHPGWGGTPWQAPGPGGTHTHLTSDGSSLLYVCEAPAGFPGDIYAIDAFNKAELWKFSEEGGLQADAIFGLGYNDEGFEGTVSLDFTSYVPTLYANSSVSGNYPVDGVFYGIDALSGGLLAATVSNRVPHAAPIVGADQIYVPTYSRWAGPPAGDDMVAFHKNDGVQQWVGQDQGSRFPLDGLLTTEQPGVAPKLVAMDERGRLSFHNAETGQEVLYRRVFNSTADQNAGSVAMVQDTLVVTNWNGSVFVLANSGVDKPRLSLRRHRLFTQLPMSGNSDTVIAFTSVFANTGCADLNVQFTADIASLGTLDPVASEISSDCKSGATPKNLGLEPRLRGTERPDFSISAGSVTDPNGKSSAPPYLVSSTWNDVAGAGGTKDLEIHVNSSLLSRGEYTFYVRLESDDTDYFLNDPSLVPEVEVRIVYGCIDDTTTLRFGYGGADQQLVTNTGRLGAGWWHEGPAGHNGFLFENEGDDYYQGGLMYGVSQRRLAMNVPDWMPHPTECAGGVYRSFLADPNQINSDCKPALVNDAVVPEYTIDGYTYRSFDASAVYSSWIDSVQLFVDNSGGWDWSLVTDPFNGHYSPDSTIGTQTFSKTIGFTDVIGAQHLEWLNDATLQILDIVNRTDVPVSNLAIAHFFDPDMGNDTVQINRSISAAWAYSPYRARAFGSVKIPYGSGYDPLCNVWGMDGYDGFWGYGTYWDSAYSYMQSIADIPLGGHMSDQDGQAHITLANDVSIAPNDTVRLAVVHFRVNGLTDPADPETEQIVDLSHVFNKLAGFGRGDVNNDGRRNLSDIIVLANYLFRGGPGPIPFKHLGDVNADGVINMSDVQYMINYYFFYGSEPVGSWEI